MSPADSDRALIVAPRGRDAPIAAQILGSAGIASLVCSDVDHLCDEIDSGAGVVLVMTEALSKVAVRRMGEALGRQASWSELPLIVFTAPGLDGAVPSLASLEARAHVTILDRPIRVKTLISATLSALLARKRQYQLRNLMEELEGRVHERDKFLAILGHELRNPLAAILLASQMLDPHDSRLDAEHAGLIERQSRHLTRLVDDLLELSRVATGKIVLQRQIVDLKEVVAQSLATLADLAQRHEVAFHLDADTLPVPVEGDPVRLEEIIGNLLTNAVKYTLPGGRADVFVERAHDRARLRVKDTGVGIDPLRIASIFGLFTQAENAIGRSQGGMGIGLSLVRSLVELHGGVVSVTSPGIGQGSEFTVELPLAAAPAARPVIAVTTPEESARFNVVIVEDNADVRTLLQIKLRRLGHTVEGVHDGEEGIERIVDHSPDLALVDLGLPGIDGYEVANRVRDKIGASVYLVALSGFGQPDDKRRAILAGFDEHVTKPADTKDLEAMLARVGRRRAGVGAC
jgi:signal transduction histidine kinase/ActR/RegA family two-component response regulator